MKNDVSVKQSSSLPGPRATLARDKKSIYILFNIVVYSSTVIPNVLKLFLIIKIGKFLRVGTIIGRFNPALE